MTSQMAAATQKMKYMMNPVIIIYTLQATMNVIRNVHQINHLETKGTQLVH